VRQVRSTRNTVHRSAGSSRALFAGVPVAVAGSIALTLSAAPAQAAAADAVTAVGTGARDADRAADSMRSLRGAATTSAPHALSPAPAAASGAPAVARVAAQAVSATYTVQRGDTVSRIAARFGLRTGDVLALNGLGWSSTIYPGQVLKLGTAAAAPAPASPAPAPTGGAYTVQRGDTISAIAKRHGVSVNAVLSANGLGWSSIIYPGQTLT
jgi:LysM repeat protein